MAAAYGGGGLGLLSAGAFGLVRAEAALARRAIGEPTGTPPDADGVYGGHHRGEPIRMVVLGDSSAVRAGCRGTAPDPRRDARRRPRRVRRPAGRRHGRRRRRCAEQRPVRPGRAGRRQRPRRRRDHDRRQRRDPPGPAARPPYATSTTPYGGCASSAPRSSSAPARTSARSSRSPSRCAGSPAASSRQLAAAQTIAVVEAGGRTVSLGDILGPEFAASPTEMFGPDRFHPSVAGYASAAAAHAAVDVRGARTVVRRPSASSRRTSPAARASGRSRWQPSRLPTRPAPRSPAPRSVAGTAARAGAGRCCGTAPEHRRTGRRTGCWPPRSRTPRRARLRCYWPVTPAVRSPGGPRARGSDRRHRAQPDRPRVQGLAASASGPTTWPATVDPRRPGQGARARPGHAGRPDARLRRAGGRAGRQHGPPGRRRARLRRAARHDGQPVLRLVGADLADGVPRDQGRRGPRVRVRRRRVRVPLPGVQRRRRRAARSSSTRSSTRPGPAPRPPPQSNETWHDPREDGLLPDVYIAMGQTAENLATSRGITRADQDEFGVRSQNLAEKAIADGFFEREIVPITHAGRHGGRTRRRPAAGRDAWRASPGSRRCSARTARSPPATAARSTTARQPS